MRRRLDGVSQGAEAPALPVPERRLGFRQRPLEWWICGRSAARRCRSPSSRSAHRPLAARLRGRRRGSSSAVLAAGAALLYARLRVRDAGGSSRSCAMAFDFAVVSAFAMLFAFESGTPTRQLLFLAIVAGAAAVRHASAASASPWLRPGRRRRSRQRRSHFFHVHYRLEFVTFQAGAGLLMALLVGLALRTARRAAHNGRAASRGGGGAARRARPAGRPARRGEPLLARARRRRSTSTRRSARSSASCAGSCRSTAWRSCSPRRGVLV